MASPKEVNTGGLKRKLSSNDTWSGRATKHRSSQACQACRTRKVRCDVYTNGERCTNCRLDDLECIVLASRRGKTRTDARKTRPVEEKPERVPGDILVKTPPSTHRAEEVPACVTFDEDQQDEAFVENHEATRGKTHSLVQTSPEKLHHSSPGIPPLPPYIIGLPDRLGAEDWEFLSSKGALTVPDLATRIEVLHSYAFSVHPFMPVLDLHNFSESVLGKREDKPVSFLLFQAVMFAGVAALEPQFIAHLGFRSAKEMREVYFNRARLLYDFDVEPDSAALVQSLLLMSWWFGRWDDRRHTWHWTGLALSAAQNMGLHREPIHEVSGTVRRFRRRLWWALYIRDRLLALGTRRPMRIRDDDFDVSMLIPDDFLKDTPPRSFGAEPPLQDMGESTRTALMCIELAKLSVCIGRVLLSHYTTLSAQSNVPLTMMVVPRRDGRCTELERCDNEIRDWHQVLAKNVRRSEWPAAHSGSHSCSEVHWAILNMVHLTLIGVLHRTQALQPSADDAGARDVQKDSRFKVKHAARAVTELTHSMLRRDEVRFLGLPGVTALVAGCLSHMQDIRSNDDDVRDASIFRFYQTMQVLQALRTIYASADSAVSFLASVIRKAGLSMPEQVDSTPEGELITGPARRVSMARSSPRASLGMHSAVSGRDIGQPVGNTLHHVEDNGGHNRSPAMAMSFPSSSVSETGRIAEFAEAVASVQTGRPPYSRQHLAASADERASGANLSLRQDQNAQFGAPTDTLFYSATSEPFFKWNSCLDMDPDLDPLAFDYNFASEALGFLDSHLQGT